MVLSNVLSRTQFSATGRRPLVPCVGWFGVLLVLSVACTTARVEPEPAYDPFMSMNDPTAAIPILKRKLEKEPQHAGYWHDLGQAYASAGRFPDSIDALKRAAQLAPERAETWAALGAALRKEGQKEEAASAYGQALTRAPRSQDYLRAYRELMEGLGRHQDLVAKVGPILLRSENGLEDLLKLVQEYLDKGIASAAEDAARQGLVANARHRELLQGLALALEQQERWGDASQVWTQVLDLGADEDAWVGKGRAALGAKDLTAADASFGKALTLNPQSLQAIAGVVQLSMAQDDLARASAALRQGLTLEPDAIVLQLAQAELYLKQGRPEQAATLLALARIQAEREPRWQMLSAQAHLEAGQPERAIEVLEKALEQNPSSVSLRSLWCQALQRAERRSQYAEECAKESPPASEFKGGEVSRPVVKKAPAPKPRRVLKAQKIKGNVESVETVKVDLKANLARLPKALHPQGLPDVQAKEDAVGALKAAKAAQAAFNAGELKKAAGLFRDATRLQPLHGPWHYNLGVALGELDLDQDAEEAFKRALVINPNDGDALFNLAVSLLRRGRIEDAQLCYEQVLKRNSADKEALRGLAGIYELKGESERAEAILRSLGDGGDTSTQ